MRSASKTSKSNSAIASDPQVNSALREAGVTLFRQDRELRYLWSVNAPGANDDVIGLRDRDLLTRLGEARALETAKMEAMRSGETVERVLPVTVGSETRLYEYTIEPWYDADGRPGGVTGTAVDVTVYQKQEDALRQAVSAAEEARIVADKARQSTEDDLSRSRHLLQQAGHVLRSPLTAILGQVSIVKQLGLDNMDTDRVETAFERIQHSSQRLKQAIDEVLDLSEIEADAGTLADERTAVDDAVADTVDMLRGEAEQAGLALRFDAPSEPVHVRGTGEAVRRIADNLISNAIKYTETGDVSVRIRRDAPDVVLEVEDTGIGIPEGFEDELFDPFSRSEDARSMANGTGLGLAITHRLVQSMDGTVDVERCNPGSRFIVRLPEAHETDADEDAPGKDQPASETPSASRRTQGA